jgi:hypothetical protein
VRKQLNGLGLARRRLLHQIGGLGAISYAAYTKFREYRGKRRVFYGLGAPIYGSRSGRMRTKYKSYYKRRARKAAAKAARTRARARRSSSGRTGGYSRSSRRRGK